MTRQEWGLWIQAIPSKMRKFMCRIGLHNYDIYQCKHHYVEYCKNCNETRVEYNRWF